MADCLGHCCGGLPALLVCFYFRLTKPLIVVLLYFIRSSSSSEQLATIKCTTLTAASKGKIWEATTQPAQILGSLNTYTRAALQRCGPYQNGCESSSHADDASTHSLALRVVFVIALLLQCLHTVPIRTGSAAAAGQKCKVRPRRSVCCGIH